MDLPLADFDAILYGHLRPAIAEQERAAYYMPEAQSLQPTPVVEPWQYKTQFPTPTTVKRRYYYYLIQRQAALFYNAFVTNIQESLNQNEAYYWVQYSLDRVLDGYLREVNRQIENNGWYASLVRLTGTAAQQPSAEAAYVLQLLKYNLMALYLNVQHLGKAYLDALPLTPDELYEKYFDEATHTAMQINRVVTDVPTLTPIPEPPHTSFTPQSRDIRNPAAKVLAFDTVVADREKFARFETALYEHQIIDSQYSFVGTHGNLQLLIVVYLLMLQKGCFAQRLFPKNKPLSPLDVRRFLDHRYQTNTEKDFRRLRGDAAKQQALIDAHFWLSRLTDY